MTISLSFPKKPHYNQKQMARRFSSTTLLTGFVAGAAMLAFASGAWAQEPSPPMGPEAPKPIEGKIPSEHPAGPHDIVADMHVESTALGFDQGVGPAVGREVSYNGKQYVVADVYTVDGQPCFSGGSHFTIAPAGGRLVVGLKAGNAESFVVASLR